MSSRTNIWPTDLNLGKSFRHQIKTKAADRPPAAFVYFTSIIETPNFCINLMYHPAVVEHDRIRDYLQFYCHLWRCEELWWIVECCDWMTIALRRISAIIWKATKLLTFFIKIVPSVRFGRTDGAYICSRKPIKCWIMAGLFLAFVIVVAIVDMMGDYTESIISNNHLNNKSRND